MSRATASGVGSRVVSAAAPTVVSCASSTPPTGTSGGPSTGRACSGTRLRTSTTCSRWSQSERVDLVVVAGDVYDRALPAGGRRTPGRRGPGPAGRLAGQGRDHQRQPRLRPAARLQLPPHRRAGVFIRTDAATVGTPVAPRRRARSGRGLRPALPRPAGAGASPGRCPPAATRPRSRPRWPPYAATSPRAPAAPGRWCSPTRSSPAAQPSESERDITVGGVALVPVGVFDGVDYVALGHLHGRADPDRAGALQRVPARLLLLRARPDQGLLARRPRGRRRRAAPTFVAAPVPRPLARLRGELETLLGDPTLAGHEASWVQVTLTDAVRPAQPMERLRPGSRTPSCIAFEPDRPDAAGVPTARPGAQVRPRHRARLRARAARRRRHRRRGRAAPAGLRRLLRGPRRRHVAATTAPQRGG